MKLVSRLIILLCSLAFIGSASATVPSVKDPTYAKAYQLHLDKVLASKHITVLEMKCAKLSPGYHVCIDELVKVNDAPSCIYAIVGPHYQIPKGQWAWFPCQNIFGADFTA